jgi:isoquinoline 1-oxidoreductase subunit beta
MSTPNRRGFLKTSAGSVAGLVIGFYLPGGKQLDADVMGTNNGQVNAWIRIGGDDSVTFEIHKAEMGQGTVTSLSQLLAEELGCDWTKVRTEFAPVDRAYGQMQGVYGSQSIRSCWMPLRKAGAMAREVLIEAAAQRWGVDKSQCRAENGTVVNTASGARLTYGQLAPAAAKLQPPANPPLKDAKQFQLIGKSVKRLDTPNKVNGKTTFGIDVRLPGMLYAAVARSPVFGGKVRSYSSAKALAVPGVKNAFPISDGAGVAVIADSTWSAFQGVKALEAKWDDGPNAAFSTGDIRKLFAEKVQKPGAVATRTGAGEAALAGAAKKIEATYEAPFLAHAPMEPLNCTAQVGPSGCEVWVSTQGQSSVRDAAVRITGLPADKVKVHSYFMGGGFGRRGSVGYAEEAIEIAKHSSVNGLPVKATWSREDDLQHGVYRPASLTRFVGALDADGWPVALHSRTACPSVIQSLMGGAPLPKGIDSTSVEGIADLDYSIPNVQVEYHQTEVGIPAFFLRSVGYSQNTFFAESFMDELAVAGGKDPVEWRRRMLAKSPRLLATLNLAAEKAGWGEPLPAGRFRGVALSNNIGSFTVEIAEVSVNKGAVKVHRVTCAVDCGHVVNPAIIEQQIRSGIVFGLTAALKGEITVERGRIQQSNFHDYDMLRIDETPNVDVHIVPSEAVPGGIGEASTPAIAPAVCNAIFAATGKRIRRLPIREQELI